MTEFKLTVHGDVVPKGRPRLAVVGGHARAYTPKKTRTYEEIVRTTAIHIWDGKPVLTDVAIKVRADFFRKIPKGFSRAKTASAIAGHLVPISRPDYDNLSKSVTDALNGVIYHDDAQIVDMHCRKLYGLEPRVEITLSWNATEEDLLCSA